MFIVFPLRPHGLGRVLGADHGRIEIIRQGFSKKIVSLEYITILTFGLPHPGACALESGEITAAAVSKANE
jgi:hypothetical protein